MIFNRLTRKRQKTGAVTRTFKLTAIAQKAFIFFGSTNFQENHALTTSCNFCIT